MLAGPPGLLERGAGSAPEEGRRLLPAILCAIRRMLMHYVFHYLLPLLFFMSFFDGVAPPTVPGSV